MANLPAPIPIPLASLKARSSFASDERLVNGYAEVVGSGNDASAVVYGAAGLSLFCNAPSDPCRGGIEVDGVLYTINGGGLYRIDENGVGGQIGTVPGSKPVIMARNANIAPQVAICAEDGVYLLQSDTVGAVFNPNIPEIPVAVVWVDGYFIFALPSGRFYISAINDITVSSLDFATAEANPDGLVTVTKLRREVYFFGSETIEVWTNTGNATFPFERLPGAVIPAGCASKYTVQELNGALYWLDTNNVVQSINGGYVPVPISISGVYKAISAVEDKTEIEAFTYQLGTHAYYVLTHSTFTWVYDVSTQLWHERQSYGLNGWQAAGYVFAFGKNIVGSTVSGNIYAIDENSYSENGQEIVTTLRTARIEDFPKGAAVGTLDIDIETGVGIDVGATSSDTVNPELTLRWSDDGAKTWKGGRLYPLGKKGEYRKRVRATRLGSFGAQGRVWEMSISSRVFKTIVAMQMQAESLSV